MKALLMAHFFFMMPAYSTTRPGTDCSATREAAVSCHALSPLEKSDAISQSAFRKSTRIRRRKTTSVRAWYYSYLCGSYSPAWSSTARAEADRGLPTGPPQRTGGSHWPFSGREIWEEERRDQLLTTAHRVGGYPRSGEIHRHVQDVEEPGSSG